MAIQETTRKQLLEFEEILEAIVVKMAKAMVGPTMSAEGVIGLAWAIAQNTALRLERKLKETPMGQKIWEGRSLRTEGN